MQANLLATISKIGRNITGQHFRIGPGHIDIELGELEKSVQHIIKSQLRLRSLDINTDFFAHLNLIDEKVVAKRSRADSSPHPFRKPSRIAQTLVLVVVEVNHDDPAWRNSRRNQVPAEKFRKKVALSTTANASDDLYKAVVLRRNQLAKI